ncbi:MAG: mechanosensitive ion channel [Anaerolineales bacterium]|nr:mechanosensitive ion channel [Anaerolineales bacterium]
MAQLGITFDDFIEQTIIFGPRIGISIVTLVISFVLSGWVARLVHKNLEKREVDNEIIVLLELLSKWGIRILGIVIAIELVWPGQLGALIVTLGIVGFTIGFALQDVAKNFVAGIILLIQQPFNIGDSIEVSGYGGVVETISLRTTELRTWDGRYVLIPNGDVFVSPIVNFTKAINRRVEILIGVAYETDLNQASRVALEAISELQGVLQDPAPKIVMQQFGDSAIEFSIQYWVDTEASSTVDATNTGIQAIQIAYDREGIEMPFPTQRILL